MDAFVAEQEAKFGGEPGERRWEDYELLQLFDRLSLYFCMRDVEGGEAAELQGYRLEPVAPWHVRLSPYPFGESPRAVLARAARDPEERRTSTCSGRAPERVEITVEP